MTCHALLEVDVQSPVHARPLVEYVVTRASAVGVVHEHRRSEAVAARRVVRELQEIRVARRGEPVLREERDAVVAPPQRPLPVAQITLNSAPDPHSPASFALGLPKRSERARQVRPSRRAVLRGVHQLAHERQKVFRAQRALAQRRLQQPAVRVRLLGVERQLLLVEVAAGPEYRHRSLGPGLLLVLHCEADELGEQHRQFEHRLGTRVPERDSEHVVDVARFESELHVFAAQACCLPLLTPRHRRRCRRRVDRGPQRLRRRKLRAQLLVARAESSEKPQEEVRELGEIRDHRSVAELRPYV